MEEGPGTLPASLLCKQGLVPCKRMFIAAHLPFPAWKTFPTSSAERKAPHAWGPPSLAGSGLPLP